MRTIIYIAVGAMAMLAAGSCKRTDKHDAAADAMPVDVAKVQTDSVVIYKTYPGQLSAVEMVDLVARVSGTLRSVNYKAGDIVQKGQLLFTVEDTKYRDAVQQAEAQLASAISTRDYASTHYAAMEKALKSDAVSVMEVRQAKNALDEAEAAIKTARAALQTARTNLGYCRITAPFRGRITNSDYSVGTFLNGEMSPVKLASIYDDSQLFAYFAIEDASFLRSFASAARRENINYDSIPLAFQEQLPHAYSGSLNYLSPEIDPSTGTMKVRAVVDNPYGELRDGMYVTISLPSSVDPKALLVNDAAVSTDQLGKYIYTVNDSDMIVYTPVKTGGVVRDTMRVVTDGVTPQTVYVTKALLKVRAGVHVKPVMTK